MKEQASQSEKSGNPRSNQRKHPRIAIELNALLRVTDKGDDRVYQSKTRDLSAGGVSIVVDRGIGDLADRLRTPEAQVLVALELRQGESQIKTAALPVWIRSTTDWVESPRGGESHLATGLSFVDMGKAEIEAISSFVKEFSESSP